MCTISPMIAIAVGRDRGAGGCGEGEDRCGKVRLPRALEGDSGTETALEASQMALNVRRLSARCVGASMGDTELHMLRNFLMA